MEKKFILPVNSKILKLKPPFKEHYITLKAFFQEYEYNDTSPPC